MNVLATFACAVTMETRLRGGGGVEVTPVDFRRYFIGRERSPPVGPVREVATDR